MRPSAASSALVALALLLGEAGAPASPNAPTWAWPVDPAVVERRFDPPPDPYSAGHRGVDLRPPSATAVVAPADGVVAFVGRVVDRDVVSIDHGDGLVSSFEPVTGDLAAGAVVRAGQSIGTISRGGHSPAGVLHFGVRRDGVYLDPLTLLRERRRAVLLPCC